MNQHCELCDMSLAFCPHGQPAPPPETKPEPKAPRKPRATKPRVTKVAAAKEPSVTARSTSRKWTPSKEFEPVILGVLIDAGGSLESEAALQAIEAAMVDHLEPGDRESTPTGELRWHLAARKARQQLIRDGHMTKQLPGLWTLAPDA